MPRIRRNRALSVYIREETCDSEASVPQNFNESYAVFHSLRSQQLKMSTNDKDEKNDQSCHPAAKTSIGPTSLFCHAQITTTITTNRRRN
ncbi:hypothetical protein T03_15318 [Trichinella britovi]|uniref:Uncharacterized protein n=1 Tax=Trichinella britovi TaxID=45882 RepID=A0A0V1C8U1_TRIBR|nr:hypothetical protein T03_15318 [Trichinella britovi]